MRHAEGIHNELLPDKDGVFVHVVHTTPGAWDFIDAKLNRNGVQQCADARAKGLRSGQDGDGCNVQPELVVVSPLTRALQTAHLLFGGGADKNSPAFVVHDLCRERTGLYTCDARRSKTAVVTAVGPLFDATGDTIDWSLHGWVKHVDAHRFTTECAHGRALCCSVR